MVRILDFDGLMGPSANPTVKEWLAATYRVNITSSELTLEADIAAAWTRPDPLDPQLKQYKVRIAELKRELVSTTNALAAAEDEKNRRVSSAIAGLRSEHAQRVRGFNAHAESLLSSMQQFDGSSRAEPPQ